MSGHTSSLGISVGNTCEKRVAFCILLFSVTTKLHDTQIPNQLSSTESIAVLHGNVQKLSDYVGDLSLSNYKEDAIILKFTLKYDLTARVDLTKCSKRFIISMKNNDMEHIWYQNKLMKML